MGKSALPPAARIAEGKSVSYHCPDFFLEVLPRANQLSLLLPLNFSDLHEPPTIAADATERQFIVNAKHEGGVMLCIKALVLRFL